MSTLVQTAAPDPCAGRTARPGEGQSFPEGRSSSQLPSIVSAAKKRAAQPLLVAMFAAENLLGQLPLLFPVDPKLPPSPKLHYRSHYRHLGAEPLLEKSQRASLSEFEVALYLIDFSPLESFLWKDWRSTMFPAARGRCLSIPCRCSSASACAGN